MKKVYQHNESTVRRVLKILNSPYDLFKSKKSRLIFSLGISGFVWFFLFTFGVFDFDYFSVGARFYYTGLYSIACLITLMVNAFLLQDSVLKKYTLFNILLWSLWLMFCTGLSNFALTSIIFKWEAVSLTVLFKNQAFTLFLGLIIIPAAMLIHYNYIQKARIQEIIQSHKNSKLPFMGNSEKETIVIRSDYKGSDFEVEVGNVLFIQSSDNYLDLYYLVDNKVQHRFIRNTLSFLENNEIHPSLIRCHRSYIINKYHILTVKGNAGGYKLILKHVQRDIPLSRKYKDTVLSSVRI